MTDTRLSASDLLNARILLLEDDRLTRELVAKTLCAGGAEVQAFGTIREALDFLYASPRWAQIVLIDYSLPDGTGRDFTDTLCSKIYSEERPAILGLTGYHDPSLTAEWLAAGAARVLVKPVRSAVLRAILAEHLPQPSTEPTVIRGLDFSSLLAEEVVEDLVREMGARPTRSFMDRALDESAAIANEAASCDSIILRRQLHSALGSAGMTGLKAMEQALKDLQGVVHAEADRRPATENLQHCVASTRSAISDLFSI